MSSENTGQRRWLLLVVMALCATLLNGVAGASGKTSPKATRVQELSYREPTIGVAFPVDEVVYCETGCLIFDVYPRERYVSLETFDSVSKEVALAVYPWNGLAGDANRYDEHHFCTSTDEPLRLPSWASKVWVEVLIGPCSDGTPATATQGTVVATFSNRS